MKSIKTNLMKIIINDNLDEFKSLSKSLESINEVINEKSSDNSLHLCSIFNSIKIIECLLTDFVDQIDVNQSNREEKRALHLSSQYKHFKCCQLLLQNKETVVDPLNRSDWTPLMLSLTKDNNLDIVKLLVEKGANLHLRNKDGWNAFHIAVRTAYLPQIQYLFDCDQSVCQTKSRINRSPLHTAALSGQQSVVLFLLDNCMYECDERDSCGITPFMESLRNDCPDISRLLIKRQKIDPFLSDSLGRNGLHLSSETNAIKSIKYLVNELNFDINCVTTIGHLTPLHLAVKEGHIETIQLLLDLGADRYIKDSKERTPQELAILLKRFDCETLLK